LGFDLLRVVRRLRDRQQRGELSQRLDEALSR
jgi:hypothetical protein